MELMARHGLSCWAFRFNRRRRAMGLCHYAHRRIELSLPFVLANGEARVRDTILHEIAHALAGHAAGHGPRWRAICRRIGATSQRCGQATMPQGPWRAACPACNRAFHRHRRPPSHCRYACPHCGPAHGLLTFQHIHGLIQVAQ